MNEPCDITRLGEQAAAAEDKKDTKKAEELGMKMDDMGKQFGPEYPALTACIGGAHRVGCSDATTPLSHGLIPA